MKLWLGPSSLESWWIVLSQISEIILVLDFIDHFKFFLATTESLNIKISEKRVIVKI